MKYNNVAKKSKLNWREILGKSLYGSVPSENWVTANLFFETCLHSREFLLSWSDTSYINRVPPAPVAPVY